MDLKNTLYAVVNKGKVTGAGLDQIIKSADATPESTRLLLGLYRGQNTFAKKATRTKLGEFLKARGVDLGRDEAALPAHAIKAAQAKLRTARDDDSVVDSSELAAIEQALDAEFGPKMGHRILAKTVGAFAESLNADSLHWLGGRYPSLEGQIFRMASILKAHGVAAQVVDLNGNGVLDAGDLLMTPDQTKGQRVDKVLADRIRVSAAMVDACFDMDAAGHAFKLVKEHYFNNNLWQSTKENAFALKPGKSPSEALDDIFEQPEKYGFECATAMVIVYYRAMQQLLGNDDFDRICQDLVIGPWQSEDNLRKANSVKSFGRVPAPKDFKDTLLPGNYAYIRNWDVSQKEYEAGWQGENIIILPHGQVYGHPFGVVPLEDVITYLNTKRKPGAKRSASFQYTHGELAASILDEDKLKTPPAAPKDIS